MGKEIALKDAKCTALSWAAPVALKQQNEEAVTGFSIKAYTGEVVDRWWGKLAIALDGIKAKHKIPVLLSHSSSQIVGHSTKTYTDGAFFVDGKFSGVTDEAEKVKGLADEGFPWQASIGVRPVKIMSIEKGGTMKVNGKNLSGPAEVWLESQVKEVSFVALGADSKTSVATFSGFEKFEEQEAPQGAEHIPHEQGEENLMKDMTLEALEKEAPELLSQIRTDAKSAGYDEGFTAGVDQERKRVTELMAIEDVDPEARAGAIAEGLSVDAAYKLFFEAEKKKKDEGLEELLEETPESVGQSGKKTGREGEEKFMDAVSAYQKENNCTRTDALRAVAVAKPDLHAAFIHGK